MLRNWLAIDQSLTNSLSQLIPKLTNQETNLIYKVTICTLLNMTWTRGGSNINAGSETILITFGLTVEGAFCVTCDLLVSALLGVTWLLAVLLLVLDLSVYNHVDSGLDFRSEVEVCSLLKFSLPLFCHRSPSF